MTAAAAAAQDALMKVSEMETSISVLVMAKHFLTTNSEL